LDELEQEIGVEEERTNGKIRDSDGRGKSRRHGFRSDLNVGYYVFRAHGTHAETVL